MNPSSQSPVYVGTRSLGVMYTKPWAGLQLHKAGFDTSPYSNLLVSISPNGNALPNLRIALYDANGRLIRSVRMYDYARPTSAGWHLVSFPLGDLDGKDRIITRVVVQEGAGVTPPAFYIDDLKFIALPGAPD